MAEAVEHLRRALAIDLRNGDARRNLAVALGLLGRLDDAIGQARIATRLLPQSAEAADHAWRDRRFAAPRGASARGFP